MTQRRSLLIRPRVRALQGIALAIGAPLGWLALRALAGHGPLSELTHHPLLYLYLFLPTAVVFALFGGYLGGREAHAERLARKMEELSITDVLTGLRNVRYFQARLEEEVAESIRRSRPLSLVVVDLDRFKRINDSFGHATGDRVLEAVGRAIAAVAREGETAARIGGEEFGILLPGSEATAAIIGAERLLAAIVATTSSLEADGRLRVRASAGVACTTHLAEVSPSALFGAADGALYQAKQKGRARVEIARASSPGGKLRAI